MVGLGVLSTAVATVVVSRLVRMLNVAARQATEKELNGEGDEVDAFLRYRQLAAATGVLGLLSLFCAMPGTSFGWYDLRVGGGGLQSSPEFFHTVHTPVVAVLVVPMWMVVGWRRKRGRDLLWLAGVVLRIQIIALVLVESVTIEGSLGWAYSGPILGPPPQQQVSGLEQALIAGVHRWRMLERDIAVIICLVPAATLAVWQVLWVRRLRDGLSMAGALAVALVATVLVVGQLRNVWWVVPVTAGILPLEAGVCWRIVWAIRSKLIQTRHGILTARIRDGG